MYFVQLRYMKSQRGNSVLADDQNYKYYHKNKVLKKSGVVFTSVLLGYTLLDVAPFIHFPESLMDIRFLLRKIKLLVGVWCSLASKT